MIKASYELDGEHLSALSEYHKLISNIRALRSTLVVLTTLSVGVFAYTVSQDVLGGDSSSALFIGSLAAAIIFGRPLLLSFKKPKAPPDRVTCDVSFDEDSFGLVTNRKMGVFERHRRYESIHAAADWNGWFIVYLTSGEACVMKHSELTGGSPEELRQFLKNKLGNRFNEGK